MTHEVMPGVRLHRLEQHADVVDAQLASLTERVDALDRGGAKPPTRGQDPFAELLRGVAIFWCLSMLL